MDIFSSGHQGIETRQAIWELLSGQFAGINEIARIPWEDSAVSNSVRDRMEATLQANPSGTIDAVFATYDNPALAAADAIVAAGRQDEMFVIGIDGRPRRSRSHRRRQPHRGLRLSGLHPHGHDHCL